MTEQTATAIESRASAKPFSMGEWTVNPATNRLTRGEESYTLQSRQMDLLAYLCSRADEVVGIEELLEAVWPGLVVEGQSVYTAIAEIRKVLKDTRAEPRYIETVPKRGYRMIAPVTDEAPEDNRAKRPGLWIAGLATGLALILLLAIYPKPGPELDQQRSLAVLPFANLSNDDNNEYIADGLSEELIHLLTRTPGLRVVARTSSFYYKGRDVPVQEIGDRLGVSHVLEGSLRRSGDRIRVTAQLIDATTGFHVFSQTYDRPFNEVFAIQDELAAAISQTLRMQLAGGLSGQAIEIDTEAWSLYIQGRFLANQRAQAEMDRAIRYLERAVATQPGFAPAWEELGNAYLEQANFNPSAPQAHVSKSLAALDRALLLDPRSGGSHALLAFIAMYHELDFEAASFHVEKALEFGLPDTRVGTVSAIVLGNLGQHEQSRQLIEDVISIDPLNVRAWHLLSISLQELGDVDAAISANNRALDLSPSYQGGHARRGFLLLARSQPRLALEAIENETSTVWRLVVEAMAWHDLEEAGNSDQALKELIDYRNGSEIIHAAQIHAYRQEKDLAFDWLRKARLVSAHGFAELNDPMLWGALHDDPRWDPLLKEMGIR